MKRDCGSSKSKIWLIGDSEPKNVDGLEFPFDLKHPTVYNIAISIFDKVQDILFNEGLRLDWNSLYIINAVEQREDWDNKDTIIKEKRSFNELLTDNNPTLIFTFGANSFRFAYEAIHQTNYLEAINLKEANKYSAGITCKILGREFKKNCSNFNENEINVIPLLHATVCRGKYLSAQANFSNEVDKNAKNYFSATASAIADIMVKHKHCFDDCFKK